MKFLKRGTCQEKGRSTPWEDERSNNKYIRGKFKYTRKNSDFVQVDNKKRENTIFMKKKKVSVNKQVSKRYPSWVYFYKH